MICIILHKHHARNTKHTPWGQKPVLLFYWNGRMGYREGRKEVKNLKIKEWFTVEFSRHQLKKKVMREAVKKEKSFIIITFFNMGGKGGGRVKNAQNDVRSRRIIIKPSKIISQQILNTNHKYMYVVSI